MNRIVRNYHVGMVVIDEIQALCVAKDNSIPVKTLNFIVELVNKIGVPVVLVGTPRALSFLQKEFQQAKRASGQGDALWEPMKNNNDWKVFMQSIWEYQYTKEAIPLTDDFINAMHKESAGVPFLAVHIYKLTQEKAILSRKESFTAADLHTVASKKMRLTKEMVSAINALLAFGVHPKDARKHVDITLAKMPSCSEATIIAREAYHAYISSCPDDSKSSNEKAKHSVGTGYEENLSKGNIGI